MSLTPLQPESFLRFYRPYALLRLMQAFGAYGYRGLHQGKSHFVRSIPYGLRTLEGLLAQGPLPVRLPALSEVWQGMIRSVSPAPGRGGVRARDSPCMSKAFPTSKAFPGIGPDMGEGMCSTAASCPTPAALQPYAPLTGRDEKVVHFLEKDREVRRFLSQTRSLVEQAVKHHLGREFTDLTVAFGCTGGRHRSVFCAERLAAHLQSRNDLRVDLHHRELEPTP